MATIPILPDVRSIPITFIFVRQKDKVAWFPWHYTIWRQSLGLWWHRWSCRLIVPCDAWTSRSIGRAVPKRRFAFPFSSTEIVTLPLTVRIFLRFHRMRCSRVWKTICRLLSRVLRRCNLIYPIVARTWLSSLRQRAVSTASFSFLRRVWRSLSIFLLYKALDFVVLNMKKRHFVLSPMNASVSQLKEYMIENYTGVLADIWKSIRKLDKSPIDFSRQISPPTRMGSSGDTSGTPA